jgi:hypothetical protein
MKLQRLVLALAGLGLCAAAAAPGPALGTGSTPSRAVNAASAIPCSNYVVWTDTASNALEADITARRPPTVDQYFLADFVSTRSMSTWYMSVSRSGAQYSYGLLLQGGNLYRHATFTGTRRVTATKLGGGWTSFKSITTSRYGAPAPLPAHAFLYGLNSNGNLYRYAPNGTGYRSFGSFGGFKSFKTMAVISEMQTYDTLLMTTTAGALYTVRIPVTATAKPVVKLIRKSGWSSFESLLVEHCGTNGASVVVGIDHNTDSGYQYGLSKANGTATAIVAYGKVPVVFNGVTHASRTTYQLTGE